MAEPRALAVLLAHVPVVVGRASAHAEAGRVNPAIIIPGPPREPEPLVLLGIDPGSRCGWAVAQGGEIVDSGTWLLAPPRGASPGVRYLLFLARLDEVLAAYPTLGVIAVEGSHHRGGAATEYADGVLTHAQSWCARKREREILCMPIHSARVKLIATGKGNASKEAMQGAALRRWGKSFDSDEADARWIVEAALREIGRRVA